MEELVQSGQAWRGRACPLRPFIKWHITEQREASSEAAILKLVPSSSAVSKEHCKLVQSSIWALVKEKGVRGYKGNQGWLLHLSKVWDGEGQDCLSRFLGRPNGGHWADARARKASATRWGWDWIIAFQPAVSMMSAAWLKEQERNRVSDFSNEH